MGDFLTLGVKLFNYLGSTLVSSLQLIHGSLDVLTILVSVALYHGESLVAADPLDCRQIHARLDKMRNGERLAEAGIAPSVGSVGDSYDNAMAETVIGLYKTELINRRAPWHHLDAVEYATLECVDWFNHRRLLQPIGDVPSAEFEQLYYNQLAGQAKAA